MKDAGHPKAQVRWLLFHLHNEVIQLLFNRFVFRTLQEIVRANERLQGAQRGRFSAWSQVVYAITNAIAVRRLADDKPKPDDVSLTRFIDLAIRYPELFWEKMQASFPAEASKALNECRSSRNKGHADLNACQRLLQKDRTLLVGKAAPVVEFASKRVAHLNPTRIPQATFTQLDIAIGVVKSLTEEYELLIFDRELDLMAEIRKQKLPNGWDDIFLEPWATRELLGSDPPLGEIAPPLRPR